MSKMPGVGCVLPKCFVNNIGMKRININILCQRNVQEFSHEV